MSQENSSAAFLRWCIYGQFAGGLVKRRNTAVHLLLLEKSAINMI